MKKFCFLFFQLHLLATVAYAQSGKSPNFPDGMKIPAWFSDTSKKDLKTLGKLYVITEHGVSADSNIVQTVKIQRVIDQASVKGGGVIVVPKGTFLSGALFF